MPRPFPLAQALACAALLLGAPALAAQDARGDGRGEATLRADLLDNGSFAERYEGDDPLLAGRVPWWRSQGRVRVRVEERGGRAWLVTPPGAVASQPVAGYRPLASGIVVRGRVRGPGLLVLVDGSGARASFELGGPAGDVEQRFELDGAALAAALGHAPQPRFELGLASASETQSALWSELAFLVPLPLPSEEALRAELLARMDEIVSTWLERDVDPRSDLVQHVHDAVTGATLATFPGGCFALWDVLLDVLPCAPPEHWRAAFERFVEAYLTRCIAPETGLPARWLVEEERRALDDFVEVHADLRFLLDVAERGPERTRERARAAALRMGEVVLAHGVLPDGQVAPLYRARDAAISIQAPPLRRLDVPAQLARLGAVAQDARFTDAARNALAAFEFTHVWPCSWDAIDPGFDDDLGTYGARAVRMLAAHPEEPAFRAMIRSGHDYYVPRWRDCLRFGGSIAADQVRSWRLLLEFARLEPEVAPGLAALVPAALRTQVKGAQCADGTWCAASIADYDPKTDLYIGDLPGTPSNVIEGLALCYDPALQVDPELVRALFTAVLRSTVEHYRRPYGYLLTQRELAGANYAGAGLHLVRGLGEMLARLPREAGDGAR